MNEIKCLKFSFQVAVLSTSDILACFLVFVLTCANIGMWVDTLFVPAGATPETAQMVHYSLTGVTLGVAILTAIAAQCMKRRNRSDRANRSRYEDVPADPEVVVQQPVIVQQP